MKIVALVVNFLLPGIGSMLIGRVLTGIVQLVLYAFGWLLTLTGILAIVGAPLCFIVLIWSLVTAARYEEKKEIVYVERDRVS